MQALDRRELAHIQQHIAQANILTYRDTADMPEYRRQCPRRAREGMPYRWRIAFLWRSFSNPILWQAFVDRGAITPAKEPNWKKMEAVLRRFQKNGLPANGGMFRATVLKKYRLGPDADWSTAPADKARRETLACKLAWRALPEQAVSAYGSRSSRDTFREALEAFRNALSGPKGLTQGKYSDYYVKCMLDALLCDGSLHPKHISTWPMDAPAYKDRLKKLFPNLPRRLFFLAGCYYHRLIYKAHNFHLGDSLAQLCWATRAGH